MQCGLLWPVSILVWYLSGKKWLYDIQQNEEVSVQHAVPYHPTYVYNNSNGTNCMESTPLFPFLLFPPFIPLSYFSLPFSSLPSPPLLSLPFQPLLRRPSHTAVLEAGVVIASTTAPLTVCITRCCSADSDRSAEGHAQHIREPFTERVGRAAADADTEETVQVGQTGHAESDGRRRFGRSERLREVGRRQRSRAGARLQHRVRRGRRAATAGLYEEHRSEVPRDGGERRRDGGGAVAGEGALGAVEVVAFGEPRRAIAGAAVTAAAATWWRIRLRGVSGRRGARQKRAAVGRASAGLEQFAAAVDRRRAAAGGNGEELARALAHHRAGGESGAGRCAETVQRRGEALAVDVAPRGAAAPQGRTAS